MSRAERLRPNSSVRAAAGQPRRTPGTTERAEFEHFRRLAETSRDVVYRYQLSPTPGIEFVSPSVLELTGYTPDELYADREMGIALVHPDDRPLLDDTLAGRRPMPDPFVLRWQRKDGGTIWIELRTSPFARPDGAIGFDGVARDITAQKAAQDELLGARQEAAQLAAMITSSDEAIIGEALDGTVTSWNPAAERLFGYTAAEMLGQSVLRLIPPGEESVVERTIQHLAAGGHVDPYETVRLAKDARPIAVSISASPVRNARGEPTGIVLFAHDVGARQRAEEELRRSEERYRRTLDAMLEGAMVIGFDWRYLYVNEAAARHGHTRREDILDRTMPEAYPGVEASEIFGYYRRCMEDRVPQAFEAPFTFPDGSTGWYSISVEPVPEGIFVLSTDISERRRAEDALRRSQAGLEEAQRIARVGSWEWVAETDTPTWSRQLCAILDVDPDEPVPKLVEQDRLYTRDSMVRMNAAVEETMQTGAPYEVELERVREDGSHLWLLSRGERWFDDLGHLVGLRGTALDITERKRSAAERDRLVAAIEQAPDAVGIADSDGTLIYANAALGELAGRPVAELLGSPAFAMMGRGVEERMGPLRKRLRRGHVVTQAFGAVRPDGSTFRAEGTIAPLRNADGAITHFTFTARDVTHEREVEDDLALETSVRAALAEALLEARPTDSLEDAVQRICDELASLPGIDYAGVEIFEGDGGVVVLAGHVPAGFVLERGVALPATHAAYVREHVAKGLSGRYWEALPEGGVFDTLMRDIGLKAMAMGPIAHEDHNDGVLVIGTCQGDFAKTLVERRPALVASSTTTSALLAERLHLRRRQVELRRSLGELIAARTFHPVFQPIVELATSEVVGYEALTRFESGQRPDLCFADAWSVGLGPDLELVTLEAAVRAASALPATRWLDLNVSARLLEDRERLREIIRSADRPVVLEITEHEAIADYGAVRDAVRDLGHDIRLAVDDAGVGVANFGHIIELQPDLVKLDISLVRRVNAHLGRQALVVGMRYFSRTAGCRLVAEGIETEEEARALRELGVEFGQGYWFGYPEPAEVWAGTKQAG